MKTCCRVKNTFIKLAMIVFILTISCSVLSSQLINDPYKLNPRYGLFGQYGYNWHDSKINSLPNIKNCCAGLNNGTGDGYGFGLLFEMPLTNWLLLGVRANYFDKSGKFDLRFDTLVQNGQSQFNAKIDREFKAKLSTFSFSPMFSLKSVGRLFFHIGANAGIYLENSFEQYDKIVQPSNMVFIENNGKELKANGKIFNVNSFDVSAIAGLSYEILLNQSGSLLLAPEVFFTYGITPVIGENNWTSNNKWKINSLYAGISLKYSPERLIELKRKNYLIDTITIQSNKYSAKYLSPGEPVITQREIENRDTIVYLEEISRVDTLYLPTSGGANLIANIGLYETDSAGKRLSPVTSFNATVQLRRDIYPVLPYVFFEHNTSKIPERYYLLSQNNTFSETELEPNSVIYHRNVLNIIGRRMVDNPTSKITLSGTTDPTTEKINCTLANQRAKTVKDYLVNTFNIEESRITINPPLNNCHPEFRTISQSEFGYSENRRVEIESSSPELLAPVQGNYYLEPLKVEPTLVMYDPQGSSKEGVNRWMLTSSIFDKVITNEGKKSKPQAVYYDVIPKDFRSMSATAPLSISYKLFDDKDEAALSMRNVKINRDTVDTLIERLILPLFDVSQFILESLYRNQIKEFLKILDGNSTMSILGYCDFLGTDRTNEYLSEMRAREISNTVRSLMTFAKITKIEGMGATKYPLGIYSYSTPEERFLSRTVEIEIMKMR
ncbi:MAG: hypothetical protein A2X61_10225 [Ignavibacteria bacterium GWB2_35_12]|nr:MAG: hypothetical protein A2X63_08375 [Ignavibacteria bacterium GWA2_35_8]OGU39741.1 MAG: hypothetical protein A2X61_10225 [Ignavibacteria bacterium GWB2_35_12]OGU91233.1 MAG: hypothetical protein A2220_16520 [Ignavibacteria bacterium RIFOXYA2_FULL_35_10]OGV21368.1 MAG: hypothetical protein A2475_15055 [Ignavibacteria bacterium RIFOXYC2_FULL_35_21]